MGVDPNSHVPIYEQIIRHLSGAIAAGVYRPGESLPSIRNLAVDLVVNPNTVQRAYQELERLGLIESRKGLRVFAAKNAAVLATRQSEAASQARFDEGITIGRAAGIPKTRIKALFDESLRSVSNGSKPAGRKRTE